jgi:hypothetical protein
MRVSSFVLNPVLLALPLSPAAAADGCRLKIFAELPGTMEGLRPLATVYALTMDVPADGNPKRLMAEGIMRPSSDGNT